MFDYILYGISGLLLLWTGFRWTSREFFLKLLFIVAGCLNIIMIFVKLGYIVKL
jgi:hypothetical protein